MDGYFDIGTGETVLMLHGSLGSKGQWRALAERIAPRFRALAVDLHGYGDNPMPRFRRRHTYDNEVALVLRRLREAGDSGGRLHLVGHSFGAGVALALARAHPRRIASLALYEPPCFPLLARHFESDYLYARALGDRTIRAVVAREPAAALRTFLDYWGGLGSYEHLPDAAREAMLARVPKAALDFDAVFAAPEAPEAWSCIAAPTLLLRGRRSPREVRRAVERLAGLMPRARLAELEGDHLMPVREAAPVNAAIEEFLRCVH
jgi:pimeloyl-ACP methyl ester carboxylesterase